MIKHLYILSFDAMNSHDFERALSMPNFSKFIKKASYSNEVKSISPSLTYPAHTSIITSTYPITHGITTNTLLQPERESPDWHWRREDIKVDTLYDKAIDDGMKVAALLWPVTAKSRIQYNLPEIFANRKWQNQILVSLTNGSPLYQYKLNSKFGHLREGISQPKLDDFVEASAIYTIETYKPNLMMVHFVDMDAMRHYHGFDSQEGQDALVRHDKRLGNIIKTIEKEDSYSESAIVILGDHSMKATHSMVSLANEFEKRGLMEYKSGKLRSYKVLTKTCDGSSYVKVVDESARQEIYNILQELESSNEAIEKVITKDQMNQIKADDYYDFMVEGKAGYYFTDKLMDNLINPVETKNGKTIKGHMLSSHGYLADKEDYYTIFAIKGPGIKEDFNIGPMSLVDEGMTFAKILGLKLDQGQGRVLKEIFTNEN